MANAQPIFVKAPRNESVKLITGAADPDGAASTRLFQADNTNGSRIHAINAMPSGGTTTATVLRIFLESASTYNLVAEVPIPTHTAVQGVPAANINILDYALAGFLDPTDRYLTLDAGDSLYASIIDTIESNLHIVAWGGDY